ncbi:ASCH domain-containing protein [Georgenia sp. MJ170]|uniref:ASCH domain-containing protein n=1 Tax=Georgenia sunbinii TaxID=3117728 RepID=UPI002F260373
MTTPSEDHGRPDDPAAPLPGAADDGDRDVQDLAVDAYWATARKRAGLTRLGGVVGEDALGSVEPPAWSFGTTPEEADALLALVLAGTKTATVSAVATFETEGVAAPRPGDLSIILDGRGRPRALITTTAVETRAFRDVDAAHAAAEGEGDRSLDHWRRVHEEFLTAELAAVDQEFTPDALVLLERFQLLDPRQPRPSTGSAVTGSSPSADSAD